MFSQMPYDYPLLWSSVEASAEHYNLLESHIKLLHASPPLIPRILHIVIAVGLLGLIAKLYKPSESNTLFDGGSLVLYMCGVIVYIANIVKGFRTITVGAYGNPGDFEAKGDSMGYDEETGKQLLTREDSLKVMSASNTILALVLVGVLVLQAGQYYAERKEDQEAAEFEKAEAEAASNAAGSSSAVETKKGAKATKAGSAQKKKQ